MVDKVQIIERVVSQNRFKKAHAKYISTKWGKKKPKYLGKGRVDEGVIDKMARRVDKVFGNQRRRLTKKLDAALDKREVGVLGKKMDDVHGRDDIEAARTTLHGDKRYNSIHDRYMQIKHRDKRTDYFEKPVYEGLVRKYKRATSGTREMVRIKTLQHSKTMKAKGLQVHHDMRQMFNYLGSTASKDKFSPEVRNKLIGMVADQGKAKQQEFARASARSWEQSQGLRPVPQFKGSKKKTVL